MTEFYAGKHGNRKATKLHDRHKQPKDCVENVWDKYLDEDGDFQLDAIDHIGKSLGYNYHGEDMYIIKPTDTIFHKDNLSTEEERKTVMRKTGEQYRALYFYMKHLFESGELNDR